MVIKFLMSVLCVLTEPWLVSVHMLDLLRSLCVWLCKPRFFVLLYTAV